MAKFTLILRVLHVFLLLQTYSNAQPMQQNETTPYPTTVVATITTDAAPPRHTDKKDPQKSTEATPVISTTANLLYKIHKADYTAGKYDVIDVSHGTLGRNVGGGSDIDAINGNSNKFTTGQTTRIYTTGAIDDDFWLKHLGDDFKNAIHLQVGASDHYNEIIRGVNDTQVHHEFLGGSDLLSLDLPYQTAQARKSSIRNTTDETKAMIAAHQKHYVYQPFESVFAINTNDGSINKATNYLKRLPHCQRTQAHNPIDENKTVIFVKSESGYGKGNIKEQIESEPSANSATNTYSSRYDQAVATRAYDISMNLYRKAELAAIKSLKGSNDNGSIATGGDNGNHGSSSILPYILRKPTSTYDAMKPSLLTYKSHFNDYLSRKQREVQGADAFERGL